MREYFERIPLFETDSLPEIQMCSAIPTSLEELRIVIPREWIPPLLAAIQDNSVSSPIAGAVVPTVLQFRGGVQPRVVTECISSLWIGWIPCQTPLTYS